MNPRYLNWLMSPSVILPLMVFILGQRGFDAFNLAIASAPAAVPVATAAPTVAAPEVQPTVTPTQLATPTAVPLAGAPTSDATLVSPTAGSSFALKPVAKKKFWVANIWIPFSLGGNRKRDDINVIKSCLLDGSSATPEFSRFLQLAHANLEVNPWTEPNKQTSPDSRSAVHLFFYSATYPKPGVYNLVLQFNTRDKKIVDWETVALTIPGAQLWAPEKVHIDQEWCLPWSKGPAYQHAQFSVQETSGLVPINVTISPLQLWTNLEDTATTFGQTKLTAVPLTLVPRQMGLVDVKIPNPLPKGTTTGQIWLSAPELSTPKAVNVEVRSRWHPYWIAFFIVLGIGAGRLFRQLLPWRSAQRDALRNVEIYLKDLAKEYGLRKDATYRRQINGIATVLYQACYPAQKSASEPIFHITQLHSIRLDVVAFPREGAAAQIMAALEAAKLAAAKAKTELDAAKATQEIRRTVFYKLAHTVWSLPEVIEEVRGHWKKQVDEIDRMLAEDNIGEAREAMDLLAVTTVTDAPPTSLNLLNVVPAWLKWVRFMKEEAPQLTKPSGIPKSVQESYEPRFHHINGDIGSLLSQTSTPQPFTAPDDLLVFLGRVHRIRETLRIGVQDAASLLVKEKNNLLQTLAGTPAANSTDTKQLGTEVDKVARLWNSAVNDQHHRKLESEWQSLLKATGNLSQLLEATIQAALPAGQPLSQAELKALEDDDWLSAANLVLNNPPVPPPVPPAAPVAPPPVPPAPQVAIPSVPAPQREIRQQILDYCDRHLFPRVSQLFAFMGIVAASYFLFEPTFLGTPRDWFILLFWGFGTNISIEALVEKANKVT